MRVTASHVKEQLGSFRQALELAEAPVNKHPFVNQFALCDGVDSAADMLAVDDFAQLPHTPIRKLIYVGAFLCLLVRLFVIHHDQRCHVGQSKKAICTDVVRVPHDAIVLHQPP